MRTSFLAAALALAVPAFAGDDVFAEAQVANLAAQARASAQEPQEPQRVDPPTSVPQQPGLAAFPFTAVAAKLAAGPVKFVCRQVVQDMAGGLDVLRFEVAQKAGSADHEIKDVQYGHFGHPGTAYKWLYAPSCNLINKVSVNAHWDQIEGTCDGDNTAYLQYPGMVDNQKTRVFFKTDYLTGIVFAKIVYVGMGHPDDIRSALVCQPQ